MKLVLSFTFKLECQIILTTTSKEFSLYLQITKTSAKVCRAEAWTNVMIELV